MHGFNSSTTVSIGKFPFDYSEQQVMDVAKTVGPIKDLKLLFDDMTGKSKGYAVIVYGDSETAQSACRNLNYMNLPNGRFLRCMFIDEDVENRSAINALGALEFSDSNGTDASEAAAEKLPDLPHGIQIHPNQTPPQVISQVVSNINKKSALQILKEAKTMSKEDPSTMKALLDKYPQLAHAFVELSLLQNTTNHELVELTLKKRAPVLHELSTNHAHLLQDVYNMTEDEISLLDESKRAVIQRVKSEIDAGAYGKVL